MSYPILPTGLEHLSEQELRSLSARIYADLTHNRHTVAESTRMIRALHRIRTILNRRAGRVRR